MKKFLGKTGLGPQGCIMTAFVRSFAEGSPRSSAEHPTAPPTCREAWRREFSTKQSGYLARSKGIVGQVLLGPQTLFPFRVFRYRRGVFSESRVFFSAVIVLVSVVRYGTVCLDSPMLIFARKAGTFWFAGLSVQRMPKPLVFVRLQENSNSNNYS